MGKIVQGEIVPGVKDASPASLHLRYGTEGHVFILSTTPGILAAAPRCSKRARPLPQCQS